MRSALDVWRRHLWLWSLPLGFCVLNLLAVACYRWAFAGQVEELESRYQATADTLERIGDEQRVIEDFLVRVEDHRSEMADLHHGVFQSERERLTRIIPEIKRLARQAGLRPSTLSYPRKSFSDHELVQRSISFSVQGTYDQLRTFINFLELTEHFIALNSVTLGESGENRGNPTLSIKLVLSTVFAPKAPPDRPFETSEAPAEALEETPAGALGEALQEAADLASPGVVDLEVE